MFVNKSFTNNIDFSSQIGYLIIHANKTSRDKDFKPKENLIHYSFIKNKRVIRSILALEIYRIVRGVDIAIAINTTIQMIIN